MDIPIPENSDNKDILAATRVRILVASSRDGRGIAGTPFGQHEFL